MKTLREQTAETILQWAEANRLEPGDLLPSERRLAALANVSHGTVNRAVTYLSAQGRLKRHGKKLLLGSMTESRERVGKDQVTVLVDWKLTRLWPLAEKIAREVGLGATLEIDNSMDASGLRQAIKRARQNRQEKLLVIHLSIKGNLSQEAIEDNPAIVACTLGTDAPSTVGIDHERLYTMAVEHLATRGARRIGLLCNPEQRPRNPHKALFSQACEQTEVAHAEAHGYPGSPEITNRSLAQLRAELPLMDGLILREELVAPAAPTREGVLRFVEEWRAKRNLEVVSIDFEGIGAQNVFPTIEADWEAQLRVALCWLRSVGQTSLPSVSVSPRWARHERRSKHHVLEGNPIKEGGLRAMHNGHTPPIWPMKSVAERPFTEFPGTYEAIDLRDSINRLVNRHKGWLGDQPLKHLPCGRKCFAGVPFQVWPDHGERGAGCVVLRSAANKTGLMGELPVAVRIPIQQTISAIYFLHACGWTATAKPLAVYRLHSSESEVMEQPLIPLGLMHPSDTDPECEPNIQDWWPDYRLIASPRVRPVPIGRSLNRMQMRFLYVLQWQLPHPAHIEALEVETANPNDPATFALVATTVALTSEKRPNS